MKPKFSEVLSYYSRKDVRTAITIEAQNKEVAVRYGTKFGKRPDIIKYERDILDFVNNGATSFHFSEELWTNPLLLSKIKDQRELTNLRLGWDLIIDVDCRIWDYSKLVTYLIVKALLDHNINKKNIFVKFSGNKGFHIALPNEIFPIKLHFNAKQHLTRDLFPDLPRIIVNYLINFIDSKKTNYALSRRLEKEDLTKLSKQLGISKSDLIKKQCTKCGYLFDKKQTAFTFICSCGNVISVPSNYDKNYIKCTKCGNIIKVNIAKQDTCPICGGDLISKFAIDRIIDIDTLLISSRHLYRSSYSIHEKTGLISLPLSIYNPKTIMKFEKEQAPISNFNGTQIIFLERSSIKNKHKDADQLLKAAIDFALSKIKNNYFKEYSQDINLMNYTETKHGQNVALSKQKLQTSKGLLLSFQTFEQNEKFKAIYKFFPPCIKNILKGLEDGRKRSVFILLNFLRSLDFDYDTITTILLEWNKKNRPPLKESIIKAQLKYHKKKDLSILPPNCDMENYYKDIGVCIKDNFCNKIRNPFSYTIAMLRFNYKNINKSKESKQTKKRTKKQVKAKK